MIGVGQPLGQLADGLVGKLVSDCGTAWRKILQPAEDGQHLKIAEKR